MLRACDKAGTVKRVVMTSSFATIIFGHDHTVDPTPYTDKEWNEKSKPTPGDVSNIYRTSKIEAERAAWQFVKENAVGFSLVTICPPMVVRSRCVCVARAASSEPSLCSHDYLSCIVFRHCPPRVLSPPPPDFAARNALIGARLSQRTNSSLIATRLICVWALACRWGSGCQATRASTIRLML